MTMRTSPRLDHGRGAQTVVAPVGRSADPAAASDDRDTLRGARSQKGKFHADKKIVKIWRLRTRAEKILRTDFRIRRKTGYERTERQGGAVHGKRAERRPKKASGTSAGEKRAERQQEKADKSSAGKSGRNVTQKEAENQRKAGGPSAAESGQIVGREKQETVGTETSGESEKSRRKNPAAFLHFGQRAERPAISRSARYSRRRPASPAVWWRRPFHGRPPSAARPFRRRR